MESGELLELLKKNGPQTGGELMEQTRLDALPLWLLCQRTPEISFKRIGVRYLRLDRNVEGYARLSPSIRREFLTYTMVGCQTQGDAIESRARKLHEEIRRISRAKLDLARESMEAVTQTLSEWEFMQDKVCFIIAGDITYEMGHAVPRPEVSTGEMVRGSDLDIIAIAEDDVPSKMLRALDAAILKKKYYLLTQPNYHEEIDYLVKNVAKIREQLAFDSFPHMIASKILHESQFLHGSETLFQKVKQMVDAFGVNARIEAMKQHAEAERSQAEHSLLHSDALPADASTMHLFYTSEEGDEIY